MAVFAASFNSEVLAFFWAFSLLVLPWSTAFFLLVFLIPTVTVLIVVGLKKVIGRDRPISYLPRTEALIFNFREKEQNKSMPSGDSAQAAAFWGFMTLNLQVPWYIAGLLIGLTMNARVYFMCHFPTDTILGTAIGLLVAYLLDYSVKLVV